MSSVKYVGMPRGGVRRPLEERFWEGVAIGAPDDCWPWIKTKLPTGYGQLFVARGESHLYAHRYAWELANGRPIPAGKYVMHSCDNPPCVNPAHLRVGTPAENTADMRSKGRQRWDYHAKLTAEQVRAIRQRVADGGASQAAIAVEFGVSQTLISQIRRGKIWRDIT